jgi:hypothetical protein
MSTCKAFGFWLYNPRVSGRGGSGPGRPSGMTRECTWITVLVEARSEGDCTSNIQILGATAIDNQLASEEVIWTFFLRVGVCIGLLGVTVESISRGEIGTRHWTGEQGAAAVVPAEERPHRNLELLLPARRDTKGELDGGAWLFHGRTVSNLGSWIFLLTAPYISIMN